MTVEPASGRDRLLEAAGSIGDQLEREAIWHNGRCTWLGDAVEPVRGEWRVVHRSCGGDLYGGSAGVAVFLARLWAIEGERTRRTAAVGAVRHALAWARAPGTDPADCSLYGGLLGVAWAAAEVGALVDDGELLAEAVTLARATADRTGVAETGDDLISGTAGMILALLDLAVRLDLPELAEVAAALGHELVRRARDDGVGLSWGEAGQGQPGLCGLAHGASGIALALLELHATGGDRGFLAAAEAAMRYERSWLNRPEQSWPDLRDLTRAQLAQGTRPAYPAFWCHGGVGIGLARLRAFELTGSTVALADAGAALQGAMAWLDVLAANPSLCHGAGGAAELFLEAAGLLGQPALRALALEIAGRIVDHHEREKAWGSGVLGGGEAPGLMLGHAGIGAVLLRAALPHMAASVGVLVRPASRGARMSPEGEEVVAMSESSDQRLIIQLAGGTSIEELEDRAAELARDLPGSRVVRVSPRGRVVLAVASGTDLKAKAAELTARSGVEYAEPDVTDHAV